jgi:putative ABC transport system permease protein
MITEFFARIRFLFSRRKPDDIDRDLDDELAFHVETSTQANIAAGMSPDEARRQAMVEFGAIQRTRERCQEQRPGWWMGTVAQDVRYALRGFRRNPVFTITVIVTLALGIGATTAVFSVVDRILFRSLPYAHDDRLVSVGMVHSLEKQEFMMGGFFFDWRDHQKPFEAMAIQSTMPHACDLIENNPAQLDCLSFDAGYLPLLGISPVMGRNFLPEDALPNGPRVVIISYGLWLDHYNRDPGILNRQINVDGSPARVVGVLPRDFQFPTLQPADVIFPMVLIQADQKTANGGFGYPMRTFARLRPGVSIEQARAEMEPLFIHARDTLLPLPPQVRNEIHLSIRSLRDRETQDVQPAAWVLLGFVLAVLLIACANVANLMMARGEARERELAVRSALGASRGRLIRQTLTEAILLSLAGAAAGLAMAEGLLRIFIMLAPTGIPFLERASLDLRIASFAALLSLACAVLFGLLPALQTPRAVALAARTAKSRKRALLRKSLVTGQIAISMVLLSGAALLLRSFQKIEDQNLGIRDAGVFTAQIALPDFRYNTSQKQIEFFLRAETALRRLPGVSAVAITDSVPPGGSQGGRFADFAVEGKPDPAPGTGGSVAIRRITPDYFKALNIPILRGRNFTQEDRDLREPLVIVSRLLASRMFSGEDPVGRRIQLIHEHTWLTVVGVAENVRNGGLVEQDQPEIYFLRNNIGQNWDGRAPLMLVSSVLSPRTVAPWVRSQIAAIDPTVPVQIEMLDQTIGKLADRPRFETALLGFFALCGLLMAVIGLYGVISFVAAQRTQEIGLRMALGATRMNILRLIAGEGVRLIAAGGVLGIGAALATAQVLKSLLFNVGPRDPATFAGVALLLALVALAATLVPARAAMKVEPVVALRYE